MDVESVRSGRSERSNHSQSRHHSHRSRHQHGDGRQSQASDGRHSQAGEGHEGHRSNGHGHRHSRHSRGPPSERGAETDQDDRASIAVNMRASGDELEGEERIEVQILPQDDNWGEASTAITGNTSETAFSMEDVRMTKDLEQSIGFNCARYVGTFFAAGLSLIAFLSPVAMVVLPKVGIKQLHAEQCGPECEGFFISFAFKMLILLIGTWALFVRKPRATMARIFVFRALVLFLEFVLTFAFWLFYWVRIWSNPEPKYYSIVLFAGQMVDGLLFIHYLSIILLEIRQLQPQYVVKIVRSPDGESRSYTVGQFSIQRLAVWCLEQYMKDFEVYNPYLEHIPRKLPKMTSGFKFYDVDGNAQTTPGSRSRAIMAAAARRRDSSHNDRFYEEQEYDRRVRKRRARLMVAAEEAFTHIKRLQEEQGPAIPMEPHQAAQTIFASMARAMQKYLRITRQQPRYTMEGIIDHLATCISHDLSPKAFLERYMSQGPVVWNDLIHNKTQTWVLVCSQLLSRAVQDRTVFQLRQGEVSLLVTVRRLPHFNLTEDVIDSKKNRFVLRLNSETSV